MVILVMAPQWNHEQAGGGQERKSTSREKRCGGTIPIPEESREKARWKCSYTQSRIENAVRGAAKLFRHQVCY